LFLEEGGKAMLKKWFKILVIFLIAFIIYAACNTQGILATENYFRVENPKLAMTPRVCYVLGTAAFRSFRYQLAIDIINRNLKDFPDEKAAVSAEYRRAVCYEKLGEYETAIKLYEIFLYNNPKDNRYMSVETKIAKLRALHKEE
jgi:tetratricopeptide (TPR) repeat protein